ncbi:MAG: SpoIID/LytB domain-containing protein [Acidimicrobiia bacterium]|nr:SpoIID/LytB domain-containing protein [Acidimicrobiia bacterium]
MGRSDRVGGPVVGSMAVAALMLVVAAPGAGAAPTASPGPGAGGWVVNKVRFEPVDGATPLTVGADDYRGAIEVTGTAGGVSTINDVALDDYVRGIAEVPPSWPAEALKAQAIAARSYALNRMAASPASAPYRVAGADICATDACQVYAGVAKEQQPGAGAWTAAVAATAGQVVLYNGAPIFAEYSDSNGGRTVGGSFPYLKSVPDPDDAAAPLHHWHYTIPLGALAGVLGVAAPDVLVSANRANDHLVYQVQAPAPPPPPPPPAPAARPATSTTAPPPGQQAPPPTTTTTVPPPPPPAPPPPTTQTMAIGDFISKANGAGLPIPADMPMAFPSDRFGLAGSGDTVTVDGGGFGHGVGMSQWGAYGKARRGMKAADILAAYYGGLRPAAMPAGQLPATIKVALAVGQGSTTVTSPGRFRVLDGDGTPLALIALGHWTMTPAPGGKVRVVPPEGYDKPLAITSGALEPPALSAGVPATFHYHLSTPAIVTLTLTAPRAAPVVVDAGVLDAGDESQLLPPAALGGAYQVVIAADAGPGRQASLPVVFPVAGPARVVVPPPSLLAAPQGEGLLTRAATAWRSFPDRLPLTAAALLIIGNALFLSALVSLRRRATGAA